MDLCCIFSHEDASMAVKHFEYDVIRDLGKKAYNKDGSIKHSNHLFDLGGRKIIQCKNCKAIFLYQWSEFHDSIGDQDSYYENYFLVGNLVEANNLNTKYSGFELETKYNGIKIWNSGNNWLWNKEESTSERY